MESIAIIQKKDLNLLNQNQYNMKKLSNSDYASKVEKCINQIIKDEEKIKYRSNSECESYQKQLSLTIKKACNDYNLNGRNIAIIYFGILSINLKKNRHEKN